MQPQIRSNVTESAKEVVYAAVILLFPLKYGLVLLVTGQLQALGFDKVLDDLVSVKARNQPSDAQVT